MEPLKPEVMVRQVETLAADLRTSTRVFDRRLHGLPAPLDLAVVDTVYLTGDGDSYHAACAAEMAFEEIGAVTCEPLSALRFLHYGPSAAACSGRTLVIAISASGGTERVLQAIQIARRCGAATLAVTGTPGSPVTRTADHTLLVDLPRLERSPGIRTYQASLLGLLLIAIRLGQLRHGHPDERADTLRQELVALADVIDATTATLKERCRDLARVIADAPAMVMLGSGPSYGTALFGAAKMIEAAGVFTAGQDLEEWSHVECQAYPDDMPTFVIAPPGRSHWKAVEVAAHAHRLGRRGIAVAHEDDAEVLRHAHTVLPVKGQVREEFSPLLYHLFASYLGSFVTERLGRLPFQSDRPDSGI
jgi:glutamine---fructose-6-phosphate transaminase (isomerizing)